MATFKVALVVRKQCSKAMNCLNESTCCASDCAPVRCTQTCICDSRTRNDTCTHTCRNSVLHAGARYTHQMRCTHACNILHVWLHRVEMKVLLEITFLRKINLNSFFAITTGNASQHVCGRLASPHRCGVANLIMTGNASQRVGGRLTGPHLCGGG